MQHLHRLPSCKIQGSRVLQGRDRIVCRHSFNAQCVADREPHPFPDAERQSQRESERVAVGAERRAQREPERQPEQLDGRADGIALSVAKRVSFGVAKRFPFGVTLHCHVMHPCAKSVRPDEPAFGHHGQRAQHGVELRQRDGEGVLRGRARG